MLQVASISRLKTTTGQRSNCARSPMSAVTAGLCLSWKVCRRWKSGRKGRSVWCAVTRPCVSCMSTCHFFRVDCFGRGSLTLSLLPSVPLSGSATVPCVIVCVQERNGEKRSVDTRSHSLTCTHMNTRRRLREEGEQTPARWFLPY